MAIDVIVLGDGTGGVIAANLLASKARKKQITFRIICNTNKTSKKRRKRKQ